MTTDKTEHIRRGAKLNLEHCVKKLHEVTADRILTDGTLRVWEDSTDGWNKRIGGAIAVWREALAHYEETHK